MIFEYKGFDSSGKTTKGKIDATSIKDAKIKIKSLNILPIDIKEKKTANLLSKRYKITNLELSNISHEIAMYIKSGVTIVVAIKIASTHYKSNKKLYLFLSATSEYLKEGKSLYEALRLQESVAIPEYYKQSIKVAESNGLLQSVLLELSLFLKQSDRVIKDIKTATIYPSFIVAISIVMVAFMFAYVVPQMEYMFDTIDQELPMITTIVLATAKVISNNLYTILISVVVLALLLVAIYKTNQKIRYITDLTLLKIPIVGTIIAQNELARLSYVSSILLKSGVSLVETISLSADTINNNYLKEILKNSSQRVIEGDKLSQAIIDSGYSLDSAFVDSIALGEETSQLEYVLDNTSKLYIQKNQDSIKVFISLLEPMMMLIVGTIVGTIIVSMLLPVFSMSI
jgi:general secretion pathway protein F/type IV pilus assembly protein PilC